MIISWELDICLEKKKPKQIQMCCTFIYVKFAPVYPLDENPRPDCVGDRLEGGSLLRAADGGLLKMCNEI